MPISSSKVMIEVEGIGKRYWVGGHRFIDTMGMHALLERGVQAPFRLIARKAFNTGSDSHPGSGRGHMRWAIRDMTFSVNQGEVLGIVGSNGAGKSVLLKILSRVTVPTEGVVRLHGSLSCMLEAGVGFHGELTGRENVHLAGSILGMRRSDIVARMDEIIAFSEIEEYLDTPVKRYSNGMRMRLGFGVSAHLETDIMLIDEVLAVGDQRFRNRCIEKMRNVAQSGKTVLFVSHDLEILQRISDRAILIRNGRVEMDGPPELVIAEHRAQSRKAHSGDNPSAHTE